MLNRLTRAHNDRIGSGTALIDGARERGDVMIAPSESHPLPTRRHESAELEVAGQCVRYIPHYKPIFMG